MQRKINKMQQELALTDAISPAWERFFAQGKEIDALPVKDWKPAHMIAYWCKRYEDHYKIKYTFKLGKSPSKSYEIFRLRELTHMLSADPTILKDYIDYVFANIIVAKKRRITSVALLTDTKTINQYKFTKLMANKNVSIDRSTTIPPNFIAIVRKYSNITTYGELSFVKQCIDNDNTELKYRYMMDELVAAGMDIGMLGRVK